MIILRQKIFSANNITLYHATRKEYVKSILKEGLCISKFKQRPENTIVGIDNNVPLIFTIMDKNKSVKPFNPTKDVMLEINIPLNVFNKMKYIKGDPFYNVYLAHKNNFYLYMAKVFKKADPEKYKEITVKDLAEVLKKHATNFEYTSPENTICFLEDIPAKYIKISK